MTVYLLTDRVLGSDDDEYAGFDFAPPIDGSSNAFVITRRPRCTPITLSWPSVVMSGQY
jgi:hypothetical protein